jgi:hypothetical protein
MASLSELRRWLPAGERSMAQAAVLTVAPRAGSALAATAAGRHGQPATSWGAGGAAGVT